ncbi:hypothetical protein L6164_009082 [Bauhinia variegata]|uniref:Uncharacterized protein n=1 Tax=Bauhinia variegata TaxID=167791 RepID=A0ACB9PJW5_BAUVA|nr:hypothetical protein L6164_009082 [Bauhinia variegata]
MMGSPFLKIPNSFSQCRRCWFSPILACASSLQMLASSQSYKPDNTRIGTLQIPYVWLFYSNRKWHPQGNLFPILWLRIPAIGRCPVFHASLWDLCHLDPIHLAF